MATGCARAGSSVRDGLGGQAGRLPRPHRGLGAGELDHREAHAADQVADEVEEHRTERGEPRGDDGEDGAAERDAP